MKKNIRSIFNDFLSREPYKGIFSMCFSSELLAAVL